MFFSNYSINDSLKETSIVGLQNSNENSVKSDDSSGCKVDESKQSQGISRLPFGTTSFPYNLVG
jgi:hypothetical protein